MTWALSTVGVSKESISKFLIGNQFHIKLRILSPENCKQSLQVKSWKAEVRAAKANKLKTTMNQSEHLPLGTANNEVFVFLSTCLFFLLNYDSTDSCTAVLVD